MPQMLHFMHQCLQQIIIIKRAVNGNAAGTIMIFAALYFFNCDSARGKRGAAFFKIYINFIVFDKSNSLPAFFRGAKTSIYIFKPHICGIIKFFIHSYSLLALIFSQAWRAINLKIYCIRIIVWGRAGLYPEDIQGDGSYAANLPFNMFDILFMFYSFSDAKRRDRSTCSC
jgi:hypothetical protein